MEWESIPYKVLYRAVKYPRIELNTGELVLILPFGCKPEPILEKHKRWIRKKMGFIEECIKSTSRKQVIRRKDEDFRILVYASSQEACKRLGVKLNRIYYRRMKTRWASLSHKKNLTINTWVKYLPDDLIEYVIFHEVAHLCERRHNDKFWGLIRRRYKDYPKIEKELFANWFVVANEFH